MLLLCVRRPESTLRKASVKHVALTNADSLLDQLINLHKSMVETGVEASSALERATNEANEALAQLQSDFTMARQTIQAQLLQEIDSSTEHAQSFLGRLINHIQTAINPVLSRTKEIQSETAALGEVYRKQAQIMSFQANVCLTEYPSRKGRFG